MAEPWIRVHANIAEKRVVLRAVDQLGVKKLEAIGLLVSFWGGMSRLGDDGNVTALTDLEIETWAGWTGKKGRFADFIRSKHADEDGRVNEWDEYAGALEDRRQKDRDRQKRKRDARRIARGLSTANHDGNGVTSRGASADSHAERQRDVTQESVPARANETKRDDTIREDLSSSPSDATETALAARLPADVDREALFAVLRMSPSRLTWALEMNAALDGMGGHRAVTPEQLGKALRDYAGNGATANPNLNHFRGYLERAAMPPPSKPPRGARSRDAPPTTEAASPYADAFKP